MTCYDKFLEKLKTIQYLKSLQKLRNQHGAVFALTALLLPVLFGFMGLGYDVGNLYLHKARLQDTADAASLAGARGYVNELKKGSSTGVISLPTGSNDTLTKRNNAIAALKTNADNYIANNNPVFQDKLQNDNRTEKFYSIGKELTSSDKKNSTEYFRVVLSEPVQLYFLPVIGIKSSADVSVYATTKLSDNEIVEGNNNLQDAEHKPVVISGNKFYDVTNHTSVPTVDNDPNHEHDNERNYYNVSTVYVEPGSTVQANVDANGNNIVYTNVDGIGAAQIVETNYDITAFSEGIKTLFRNKQNAFKDKITQSTESELKAELKKEYDSELITYNALKTQYDNDKAAYDQAQVQYEQDYQTWLSSYPYSSRLEEVKAIWNDKVGNYWAEYAKNNFHNWNYDDSYNAVKTLWENDNKPYTKSEAVFSNIFGNKNNYYNMNYEPNQEWQINLYEGLWMGNPPPEAPTLTEPIAPIAPVSVDVRYEKLLSHVNDEYYMTYHGERMNPFKTSIISADTLLSGPEHSYFYLSWKKAGYNAKQTEVTIDGFYVDPPDANPRTINENTPFYLFIEDDVDLTEFKIKNTNRPLILCYLGSSSVHYQFDWGASVDNRKIYRGFIYAPSASGDTHINGNNIDFRGSIVAEKIDIHSQSSVYKYDVDEIQKWKDEGLPVTPNVGFTSSTNPGDNPAVDTEKITIPDHLRLVLASSITDDSHYNQARVSWTLIE